MESRLEEYTEEMKALLFQIRRLPGGKNVKLLYFHAFLVDYMKSSLMNKNKTKSQKKKKKTFFLAKKITSKY